MNPSAFFADYDAFGERRTGGDGDAAAAAWLRDRAEAAGAEARLLPAPFTRLTPGSIERASTGGWRLCQSVAASMHRCRGPRSAGDRRASA